MADERKAEFAEMGPRSSRPKFTTYDGRSMEDVVREALVSAGIMGRSRIAAFLGLFCRYMDQKQAPINWKEIEPTTPEMVTPLEAMEACPDDMDLQHEMLNKLAILKLNGGLGTTMGCTGPKSAIDVRAGDTFLDLTVRQVEFLNSKYGVDVPLVLMNSFTTHEDTIKILAKYRDHNIRIHSFVQSCFPCLYKDTMLPAPVKAFSRDSQHLWYPPGHGDLYQALFESGLLENLINQGKEYLFVSNVDNLAATVDLNLLYGMITADSEFVMEVTQKTRADLQGGTLVNYKGKLTLLEQPEVPREHVKEFQSVRRFPHFNTNNLWVNLRAIQRLVASDQIHSSVFVTTRNVHGDKVLQLETAAGAAIRSFTNPLGVLVPRARFLPVKSTSDLFLVQSNLFIVKHGSIHPNEDREFPANVPLVKLGPEFQRVDDYERRFRGEVDVRELEHLTVSGDVAFGEGVVLRGTVIVVANEGCRIDIPPGSVLEDKVVTGSLRITDHYGGLSH